MDRSDTSHTRKGRSSPWRGVAVVAAMLLAAGAIAPAFGAAALTKKKATSIVKNQVRKVGDPRFIEESELIRFSPAFLNAGQSVPLTTVGPFEFVAVCDEIDDDGDGPPLEERGRILLTTSEDNSAFSSDEDEDNDFDVGPLVDWAEETADDPGEQDINSEDGDDAHASAPSGTRIAATSNRIVLNEGGADCSISGSLLVLP
jgi:hypothetical protein